MEFLSKFEYALVALIELAACYPSGEPLQIQQIAALQALPKRYLEQVMAALKHGGLIRSIRGRQGGYLLTREPSKITLLEALICLEDLDPTKSVNTTPLLTPEREVIQEVWQEVCLSTNTVWRKYTLQDVCERRKITQPTGLMYYI